jgi:uncharacterized RmlC-like cupin family protein
LLLADPEDLMGKYIVNLNEVPVGKITGRETRDLISGKTVGSKGISLRIADVLPGAIFILSGHGEIKIGEEAFPMKVGDAIHLPTGVPHLIRNTGKEVMRMACSFSSNDISRDLKSEEKMKF